MDIAIIGYGSIGKRHEKNCLRLGHRVDVLSRHEGRKLTRDSYDLVIICSKTSEHLTDVKKFKNFSANFLVEKPLAATSKGAVEIKKILSGKKVRVGYCLIFNPIVEKVKDIVSKNTLGDIFFAQIYAGSYLPSWRTGEDYRKRYSARAKEGGGVALDLIHEINYTRYFFPDKINSVWAYQGKVSNLEITSSDLAHFVLLMKAQIVTISLNYFQLLPERYIKLVGSIGTLVADLVGKKVEVFDKAGRKIISRKFDFDTNQMYIDEVVSMTKFISGEEKQKEILGLDQAIADLKIIEGKNV